MRQPSDQNWEAKYWRRELDSDALKAVDEGLSSRTLVSSVGDGPRSLTDLTDDGVAETPGLETLEAFLDGRLDAADTEWVTACVETDPTLREQLEAMREARAEAAALRNPVYSPKAKPKAPSWLALLGSVGVATAACSAALYFSFETKTLKNRNQALGEQMASLTHSRGAENDRLLAQVQTLRNQLAASHEAVAKPSPTPPNIKLDTQSGLRTELASRSAETRRLRARLTQVERQLHSLPTSDRVAFRDGDASVVQGSDGRLYRLDPLVNDVQKAMRGALALNIRPELAAGAVYRGAEDDPISLRWPVREAVLETRPKFEWVAGPTGTTFGITIVDAEGTTIVSAEGIKVGAWVSTSDLPRGRTLFWSVTSQRTDGGTLRSPRRGLGAPFLVLSQAEASAITAARAKYGDSPCSLGVLLAEAGLLREAKAEIDKFVLANPGRPDAQQLLHWIEAALSERAR